MKENKLKINIPKGYEVDKELSTFEEIFFKKIEYSKLPRTWNEYRELTEGEKCYTLDSDEGTRFGCIDEFDTKKRTKEYAATDCAYKYCIPYNDDTKHLVGTFEEAPEFYRYWED